MIDIQMKKDTQRDRQKFEQTGGQTDRKHTARSTQIWTIRQITIWTTIQSTICSDRQKYRQADKSLNTQTKIHTRTYRWTRNSTGIINFLKGCGCTLVFVLTLTLKGCGHSNKNTYRDVQTDKKQYRNIKLPKGCGRTLVFRLTLTLKGCGHSKKHIQGHTDRQKIVQEY